MSEELGLFAKVYLEIIDHPKFVELSDSAFRLAIYAWLQGKKHPTGGTLSQAVVNDLCGRLQRKGRSADSIVRELCVPPRGFDDGLWERHEDERGVFYRIHDFDKAQKVTEEDRIRGDIASRRSDVLPSSGDHFQASDSVAFSRKTRLPVDPVKQAAGLASARKRQEKRLAAGDSVGADSQQNPTEIQQPAGVVLEGTPTEFQQAVGEKEKRERERASKTAASKDLIGSRAKQLPTEAPTQVQHVAQTEPVGAAQQKPVAAAAAGVGGNEQNTRVRCPPDLQLSEAQLTTLSMAMVHMGCVPVLTAEYVASYVSRPDERTLDAWRSGLAKKILETPKAKQRELSKLDSEDAPSDPNAPIPMPPGIRLTRVDHKLLSNQHAKVAEARGMRPEELVDRAVEEAKRRLAEKRLPERSWQSTFERVVDGLLNSQDPTRRRQPTPPTEPPESTVRESAPPAPPQGEAQRRALAEMVAGAVRSVPGMPG